MYEEVTIDEIKYQLDSINLIDMRDNYIYKEGSIPNAINIPSIFLMINPNEYLDKNKKYYIFCSHGNTSKRLTNYLNKQGYDVVNIIGGYNSYIKDSII